MRLPLYQIDAFAEAVFRGNPAAVCPLERWLSDATMQSIAAENNLAETAFFVPRAAAPGAAGDYDLRWFTPRPRSTCAVTPRWPRGSWSSRCSPPAATASPSTRGAAH